MTPTRREFLYSGSLYEERVAVYRAAALSALTPAATPFGWP